MTRMLAFTTLAALAICLHANADTDAPKEPSIVEPGRSIGELEPFDESFHDVIPRSAEIEGRAGRTAGRGRTAGPGRGDRETGATRTGRPGRAGRGQPAYGQDGDSQLTGPGREQRSYLRA